MLCDRTMVKPGYETIRGQYLLQVAFFSELCLFVSLIFCTKTLARATAFSQLVVGWFGFNGSLRHDYRISGYTMIFQTISSRFPSRGRKKRDMIEERKSFFHIYIFKIGCQLI